MPRVERRVVRRHLRIPHDAAGDLGEGRGRHQHRGAGGQPQAEVHLVGFACQAVERFALESVRRERLARHRRDRQLPGIGGLARLRRTARIPQAPRSPRAPIGGYLDRSVQARLAQQRLPPRRRAGWQLGEVDARVEAHRPLTHARR
jgi:hypothetical protein